MSLVPKEQEESCGRNLRSSRDWLCSLLWILVRVWPLSWVWWEAPEAGLTRAWLCFILCGELGLWQGQVAMNVAWTKVLALRMETWLNRRCVLEAFLLDLGSTLNHKSGNISWMNEVLMYRCFTDQIIRQKYYIWFYSHRTYIWGNWGPEMSSNLPETTQLVSSTAALMAHCFLSSHTEFSHLTNLK